MLKTKVRQESFAARKPDEVTLPHRGGIIYRTIEPRIALRRLHFLSDWAGASTPSPYSAFGWDVKC